MYTQTNDDFSRFLNEQCRFLEKSNKSWDRGDLSESKRIAVALRVLLHDTASSRSILYQLGRKNDIKFLDTSGEIDKKVNYAVCNFVALKYEILSGKSEIEPLLDKHVNLNYIGFDEWWNKLIYYDPINGNELTRKLLILTLANKDGGAHVDKDIDNQTYVDLTKNNAFGWKATINGNEIDTTKALYSMVRQVSFEVLYTLKKEKLYKNRHLKSVN